MESAASMDPTGGKRRGIRRWRLVIPLLLLTLPAVVLLAINLLLATPWCCRKIAWKIQKHAGGLEASVGGAVFTPWGGFSIRKVELLQPPPLREAVKEPLIRIESLRVAPVWRAWLRGRPEVRDIELDTPRIVLPVELISHLAKSAPTAPPTPAPSVAIVPPPATGQPPAVQQPPVGTPPPVAVADAAKSQPPATQPPSQPTGWLRLKHASFAFVHAGPTRDLLDFSDISGSIPIAGDTAQSVLTIGPVSILGIRRATDIPITLEWKAGRLTMKPLDGEIGGCKFRVAAQLATFSGLPLQIDAQIPRQKLAATSIPFQGQAEAEAVAATARFVGLLLAPVTWQADAVAECQSAAINIASHEAKFDRGQMITVLRGGILSCADARLVGDDLSLLGNATLLADGRVAGAARVVATPETAATIASRTFSMIQGAPSLTPLSTPQRSAFDLEAGGTIGQLFLRLGKDGPIVELKP